MRQKSAKDIAFEKERIKFRREIKDLKHRIDEQENEIRELHSQLSSMETRLQEKDDWIHRLLEYMDLDRDQVKAHIDAGIQKLHSDLRISRMSEILGMFGMFL